MIKNDLQNIIQHMFILSFRKICFFIIQKMIDITSSALALDLPRAAVQLGFRGSAWPLPRHPVLCKCCSVTRDLPSVSARPAHPVSRWLPLEDPGGVMRRFLGLDILLHN